MKNEYPEIIGEIRSKHDPGLQVADLLLWSAVREKYRPDSPGATVASWCGSRKWGDGHRVDHPHEFVMLSFDVNDGLEGLMFVDPDDAGYPVKDASALDSAVEPIDAYAEAERFVRLAVKASSDVLGHAAFLRPRLAAAVEALTDPERVGMKQVLEVGRQFLRIFDTVPLYRSWPADDSSWAPALRVKKMVGFFMQHEENPHAKVCLLRACEGRNALVKTRPEALGLPRIGAGPGGSGPSTR